MKASARRLALFVPLSVAPAVHAGESWLALEPSPACSPQHEELVAQVQARAVGSLNAVLRAEVLLFDREGATEAHLRLTTASRVVGTKQFEAPSCEEAVEAVAVVLALAFSSETVPDARDEPDPERRATPARPGPAAPSDVSSPEAARPEDLGPDPSGPGGKDASAGRGWLAIGMDRGSVVQPLALVGLGAAATLGRAELRGAAWYSSTSHQEVVQEQGSVTESASFTSVTLDYCHALDSQRWVMGCAGFDFGLVLASRVEQSATERASEDELEPSLRSNLGALFALREGLVQPELFVSTGLLTLGSTDTRDIWAFRAALGAAVPF